MTVIGTPVGQGSVSFFGRGRAVSTNAATLHPWRHNIAAAVADAALDLTDRKIRQLAEAADGLIVSGPGSPGYCHLYHCPAETIGHITATQISQAKHMIRRALRTRKRAHQLIR